ncbi:MAG: PAS domain S-box protein [Firmicutes bacterium]|nr:PAS domain S-box protein [Bacillota bacterium]
MTEQERRRLQALIQTKLLDTDVDPRFERITQLARQVFDVPIALISLLDSSRQWFKSKQGIDIQQTPRCHAFCHYAVEADAELVVPDAKLDPRFVHNPLVTGAPHIRAYAGVPIHSPDGFALGTLCIIDTKPRHFDTQQLRYLQDLAHWAESTIKADYMTKHVRELEQLRSDSSYQARMNDLKAKLALHRDNPQQGAALKEHFNYIVKACAKVMGLSNCSIWLGSTADNIICQASYDAANKCFEHGATLAYESNMPYWQHLVEHGVLVVHDTQQRPAALATLQQSYLEPNHVTALLDVLIVDETGFKGCLCFEIRHQPREWTDAEISFASDIANLITTLLIAARQREAAAESAQLATTLSTIMEAAVDVAIIATDCDGLIHTFNRGAETMLGYRSEEVIQQAIPTHFHDPDELAEVARQISTQCQIEAGFDIFKHAVNSSELNHRHWRYIRKDGSVIQVLLKLSAMLDTDGQVTGYLGIAIDVEDELNAQRELQLQESRLRALFELSPVGIALNDFETGQFLDGNLKLLEPTGYTEAEFKALSYFDLTPPEYFEKEKEMLVSMEQTGRYGPFEKEYIRKDGSRYPILLNGVVVEDQDGRKLIWSIIEDISERKHLESLKNQFISTVSHELRTPLTSVSGALALLQSGRLGEMSPKASNMLNIAANNSKRLISLINDLLDFEKLASGNMNFDFQLHSAERLIRAALDDNSTYAAQHGIDIHLRPLPEAIDSAQVYVDEQRFQQVMSNLISNAVKFSPEGSSVEITVTPLPQGLRVLVSDHGPGIPEEFRNRIFKRFQQAMHEGKATKSGTGLGLAITRELVEAMHGKIDFVSTVGEGSCFYFDLPLRRVDTSSAAPACAHQRAALVIEDDLSVCEVLAEMYLREGFDVRTATTIHAARELIHRQSFQLISLDLKLPDGKGLDFLHEIRASELNASAKVIIISGQPNEGSSPANYRSAQLDWLIKPVPEDLLTKTIDRLLGQSNQLRILHVEDDTDLSQVVSSMLGETFKVKHARSVYNAQELMRQHKFDIVLLDIGLPDGSGASLIPEIKAMNADCAIVILSGQHLPDSKSMAIHDVLLKTDLPSLNLTDKLYRALKTIKGDAS